jgi:hypothetical protein
MFGPKPPVWFEDNGCTHAPDGWWTEACRYHDWHYSPWTRTSRIGADWYFFLNLICCKAPMHVCLYYPLAVRVFGKKYFKGKTRFRNE